MTPLQLTQNDTFTAFALAEAMELLSQKTGISVESLIQQFPTNKSLQESCAKLVAEAAKVTASELTRV